MLDDRVEIRPEPIGRGVAIDEAVELRFRPVCEPLSQRLLPAGDAFAAGQGRVPAAEQRFGLEVEGAEQLALPAGPHAGPDRADIGDGQHEQELQPFAALHQGGEIANGLGVVEVAALGELTHGQVMLDQPRGGLGLGRVQAKPRAELAGDPRADDRMILVPSLGDVVNEGGDIERTAIVDGADDLARHRMLGGEAAALDARQKSDGADQVLVHGEVVVHVELHHRDDAPEIRDEAPEHARLVHLAQHAFGIACVGQKAHEQAIGGRVGAKLVVDQAEVRANLPQHLRRERRLMLVGEGEQADEVHRILGEGLLVHGGDAAVLDAEIRRSPELGAAAPAERGKQGVERGQRLQLLHFERRADDPGQLADLLGHQEVVTHEALDRAQTGMPAIAEPVRHGLLQVEGETLLGAPGEKMQLAAHGPEEALAAAEAPIFVRGEYAGLDELSLSLVGIEVLGEPVQRVQVAQPALAVLDVGLDEIARGAGAGMARVLLGELRLDEGPRVAVEHIMAEPAAEFGKENLIAQDQPRVEERGADGHVGMAAADALVDVARGMADLEAQVPKQIEHVFGDALAPRGLLVGEQEQEIDVRAGGEKAAPVAALRHDRHAFRRRRIVGRIDVPDGEVVSERNQGVLEGRKPFCALSPVAVFFKLTPGRASRLVDKSAHALEESRAKRRGLRAMDAGELGGLVAKNIEVEIGCLFRGGLVHGGACRSLAHGRIKARRQAALLGDKGPREPPWGSWRRG